jgi:DNA-binding transcriptional MerR regulator
MIDSFRIQHAARLSGLSITMIDYLCRTKIVAPSRMGSRGRGRGTARRFSFGDVVLLRTYSRLLAQGVSVKRLKEAHHTWSRQFKTLDDQLTPPPKFLLTDGHAVYLRTSDQVVAELNKDGQFAFGFIVDLHQVRDEVIRAMGT